MYNDKDAIQAAVAQRLTTEKQEFISSDNPSNGRFFTDSEVLNFIKNEELGIGDALKRILSNDFIFETRSGRWYMRDRHLWKLCQHEEQFDGVKLLRTEFELCRDALFYEASELRRKGDSKSAENIQARAEFVEKRGVSLLRRLNPTKKIIEFSRVGAESLAFDGEQFDLDPWTLAVQNGLIDLRTGLLSESPGDNHIRKFCPINWQGLDAPCPMFDQYLKQTFFDDYDGTLVNHLIKLLGLALIGEQIEHVLILLFGFGRNGKGTLVELINFVLGSYARTIPSAMLLDRGQPINPDAPSPSTMALQSTRLAFAAETGKGRRFSVELLKNFTGNDTLTARRGYDRDDTNFRPTHTLFVQTNYLPKADPQDVGFWDRVHTIQFNARYTKDEPQEKNEFPMDVHLPQKLAAEAPGVLARLVRGCLSYQEEGIIRPYAVLSANKEYNLSVDHLAEFFGVCFAPENDKGLKVTPLYKAYLKWAEFAGVRPVGRDSFFDSVKRRQKISNETHGDGHGGLYSGLDVIPEGEWQC